MLECRFKKTRHHVIIIIEKMIRMKIEKLREAKADTSSSSSREQGPGIAPSFWIDGGFIEKTRSERLRAEIRA